MTKPLSIDLRLRVVEAVDAGMSRRAAADRFGIAASAAIKWHELWRRTGAVEARPQGGDTLPSYRSAGASHPCARVRDPRHHARGDRRAPRARPRRALCALSRPSLPCPARDQLQKKPRTPPNRIVLTSRIADASGLSSSRHSIPSAWCSSTRPALPPRWRAFMAAPRVASAVARQSHTDTGRPRRSLERCGSKA